MAGRLRARAAGVGRGRRRGPWRAAVLAGAGLCVALSPAARAAVVLALSFEDLAARADRIALGVVDSVAPRWAEDGRRVETVIDVRVDGELGNVSAGGTARIVQFGGRIGDRGTVVPGMPEFRAGERVLLFLRAHGADRDGTPVFSVVGMAQGKFVVVDRPDGGRDAVQDLGGGITLVLPADDGALRPAGDAGPLVIDLGEAIARIRAVRGEVAP
jgi:hypothetical protein